MAPAGGRPKSYESWSRAAGTVGWQGLTCKSCSVPGHLVFWAMRGREQREADRAAEGCDAQAVSGVMGGLGWALCRQRGTCLLLHLSGAQRNGTGKGHASCHSRPMHPHTCLGLGKPQPRSNQRSPEREPQTLLCPSHAPLAFGASETGANTEVRTQQGEGTFQLQFTSRKRGVSVTGLGHTVGERWCSAGRSGETERKTWNPLGFE